jgi:hypothetical protein
MASQSEINALEEKYSKMKQEVMDAYPWPLTHTQKDERDKRLAALDDQHSSEVGVLNANSLLHKRG